MSNYEIKKKGQKSFQSLLTLSNCMDKAKYLFHEFMARARDFNFF